MSKLKIMTTVDKRIIGKFAAHNFWTCGFGK